MRNDEFHANIPLHLLKHMPKEVLEHWKKFPEAKDFQWDMTRLRDPEYREALRTEWKRVFGEDKELYFANRVTEFGGTGKISVICLEPGNVVSYEDLDE